MEWFLIVVGIIVGLALWSNSQSKQEAQRRADEAADRLARKQENEQKIEQEIEQWSIEKQNQGWVYQSVGKFMHRPGQPKCIMALSKNSKLLRFDIFHEGECVRFEPTIYLNLNQVISLNVARPTVQKTRKTYTPLVMTDVKRRSPIGRGLLGGALLGPAGLVLGAASGLNAKSTQRVENYASSEQYEALGAPQLIIGTTNLDHPVLKIQCSNSEVADEWMFRIRGAQSGSPN